MTTKFPKRNSGVPGKVFYFKILPFKISTLFIHVRHISLVIEIIIKILLYKTLIIHFLLITTYVLYVHLFPKQCINLLNIVIRDVVCNHVVIFFTKSPC